MEMNDQIAQIHEDMRAQKRMYLLSMAAVAEEHTKKTGQKYQMFVVGGKVGGFLVPVKKLSD